MLDPRVVRAWPGWPRPLPTRVARSTPRSFASWRLGYRSHVLSALVWGVVAASSLMIGALLGVARHWDNRLIGAVLGFGAGALISSVSFELVEEGLQTAGGVPVALGLAAGALTFFLGDRAVERMGGRSGGASAGLPLLLGALLDGIPEQVVLGIGLAAGEGVSIALLVAIFVSNLPESIGSATDMSAAGRESRTIVVGWAIVAAVCALATVGGYWISSLVGDRFTGAVDGFAAGALLVMLVGSMIPEAKEKASTSAGLTAVLGFAVAAGLSAAS
jgi:ZIP family zinc transporter